MLGLLCGLQLYFPNNYINLSHNININIHPRNLYFQKQLLNKLRFFDHERKILIGVYYNDDCYPLQIFFTGTEVQWNPRKYIKFVNHEQEK